MTRRWLLTLFAVLVPGALVAHDGGVGPHGGPTSDAGPYFLELVTQPGALKIFVFNDATSKPEDVKAVRGTATVLLGQQREIVQLQFDAAEKDGNLLAGKLTLTPGAGLRVVVQLQIVGQPSLTARFAL